MVSEKYIGQLLDDIQAAHKIKKLNEHVNVKDKELIEPDEEFDPEEYFREVENFIEFDESTEPSLGNSIGIQRIQFPKAEDLDPIQIIKLNTAFDLLLTSYNLSHDLPKEMPTEKYYTLLISILDESMYISEEGMTTWEFCTYDPDSCPIGETCACIEYEREFEQKLADGIDLMEGIIESCEDLILEYKTVSLEISSVSEKPFGLMCMFIAGGSDYVVFEVYQNADVLQKACDLLKELFAGDAEIISLFEEIGNYKVHQNLQVLLSMEVENFENGIFYVEPYYIDNGLICKGIAPVYTPEELMNKLENPESELPF
jgi:hypothetical protein